MASQFLRFFSLGAVMLASGCSHMGTIQPAASSQSGFVGAVYAGDTAELVTPTPGAELFRVFHQGASSFVSVGSVRGSAERRAATFCANLGRMPRIVRETTSRPPHILGNFPRVELEFECADRTTAEQAQDRYARLERLKKLLDTGALTEQEYAAEKARLLSTP